MVEKWDRPAEIPECSVYIGIININLLIGEKAKTLDIAVGFIWIGK